MAGSITVSSITLDSDNNFSIKSNTGATLFFANTSGVDIANSIGATAITSDKILSIANTKISGNIISSQITSVANTQISGNIVSSQITSVANTQITGNIVSSQITSVGGSQITANTIANSAFQTGSVENYMNAAGLGFGMRNRIINGDMRIAQRGTSAVNTNVSYPVDRFRLVVSNSSKVSLQQSSTVPTGAGFVNSIIATSLAATTVGAGDTYELDQQIEGYNIADLMWGTANAKTVTLSFWVRSSLTGTFGGTLESQSNARAYPFSYTISSANTWEQKTITVAGDTSGTWVIDNSRGLIIRWSLGTGSTYLNTANAWVAGDYQSVTGETKLVATNGATWYLTGVQLEKGSTATSFDYRDYGTEFALCQRYFQSYLTQICQGYNAGTGPAYLNNLLPVVMRTAPTTVEANITYSNASGLVNNQITNSSVRYRVTVTATGGGQAIFDYTASAEL